MSIIYTMICKDKDKILCEYTEYHGNFEQISRGLLKNVLSSYKATFSYDDTFYFHYLDYNRITIMSMTDNKFNSDISFSFLEDVKDTFFNIFSYQEIDSAISYSLNSKFDNILKKKMDYYNKHFQIKNNNNNNSNLSTIDSNVCLSNENGGKIALIVRKFDSSIQSSNYFNGVNINLNFRKQNKED